MSSDHRNRLKVNRRPIVEVESLLFADDAVLWEEENDWEDEEEDWDDDEWDDDDW